MGLECLNTGRYVGVFLAKKDYLTICEFQVFGRKLLAIAGETGGEDGCEVKKGRDGWEGGGRKWER